MEMIVFLIVFPLIVAALLFVVRQDAARNVIVYAGAGVIALASIAVALLNLGAPMTLIPFQSHAIDLICLGVSCVIAAIILAFAFKYRNVVAAVLAVVQILLALVFEFVFAPQVEVIYGLYLDSLSLSGVIIGVVGTGICVYALGYMKDFQAHEPSGSKDRRPTFFAIMFVFLSAMYVIVFSNNMVWMFTGWEVTTVCSFLLIGYTKTDEAIRNAFRQIVMNLLGGIAFVVALLLSASQLGRRRSTSSSTSASTVPIWSCSRSTVSSRSPASPRPRRCPSTRGFSERWLRRRPPRRFCILRLW